MSGRALFLDRDGTLVVDVGYPRDPALVQLIPGALEALRDLEREFALVVVSNQSGIGRGLITPAEAAAVDARVRELFAAGGIEFAGVYHCPHAPDDHCTCRKPKPGMLEQAARELDLDLATSVIVGDKASDLEAGLAVGARGVRFEGDWKAIKRALLREQG
ncbi:MAG TPA: HAD family hydrolase [Byssovorax sp.]